MEARIEAQRETCSTRASAIASSQLQTKWSAGVWLSHDVLLWKSQERELRRIILVLSSLGFGPFCFHASVLPVAAAIASMMSLRQAMSSLSEALGFHTSCEEEASCVDASMAVHADLSSVRSPPRCSCSRARPAGSSAPIFSSMLLM